MSKHLFLALEEQLEIEKVQDLETQANKTGEYEVLYDNLKQLQDAEDKKGALVADGDSQNSDSDMAGSDSSLPSDEVPSGEADAKEQGSEEDQSASEDDGLAMAKEDLKNLTYSLESYDFESPTKEGIMSGAGSAVTGAIAAAFTAAVAALTYLGVTYGPSIIKGLYKGVIYVFGKLAKLLYVSTVTLSKYIERRVKSFDNLKSSIDSLQKSVELIKSKEIVDLNGQQFTDEKVINALKIGHSVDFKKNIDSLTIFLDTCIKGLNRQISNDIGSLNHVMAFSKSGATKLPDNILTVKPIIQNMVQGEVEGYNSNTEITETYKYNEVLPSDVVLIAVLPRSDLDSLEQFTQGYNHSKLFLGVDMSSFQEVRSVDYMTPQQLNEFLNSLKKLCDECIAHQSLYEKIAISKKHLKFGFKNYFMNLATSSSKVPLKDSLVEYVYLKSMFIDKVYLTAAMDIHDYSAKIISLGLSYVQEHVKKMS